MLWNGWKLHALAVGALLALSGAASADDETFSLKLSRSPANGSQGILDEFVTSGRDVISDDDTEEVNLRYRRGYMRGAFGGNYYFPRAYAFRSGYYAGAGGYGYGAFRPYYYGRGYYRPSYYYGRSYYYPRSYYYSSGYYSNCYYYTTPISYTADTYADDYDICDRPTYYYSVPSTTYRVPSQQQRPLMAEPLPPATPKAAPPMLAEPEPKGRTTSRTPPTYNYDGGPSRVVPGPGDVPAAPNRNATPRIDPNDGRLVKLQTTAKKVSYPAYGDNRRKTEDNSGYLVKKEK